MDGDVKKTDQVITKLIIQQGLDGAQLIPVDLGGRLISPMISINELGKQLLNAACDGNVDEIKLLMHKGAPFTADWLGTSPLHFAAQNNHLQVCEILLKAGISKDARTKVDRTPLHIAVYEGHIEIVKCLLQHKADVECKDLLSMTPLHWAAQNGHTEIAALLIRYGAKPNVFNKFNLTPIDIALQCNRPDIIDIINLTVEDPQIAAHNLTLELNEMNNSTDSIIYPPVETVHEEPSSPVTAINGAVYLEDIDSENSVDPERLHIHQEETIIPSYQEESEIETIPEVTHTKFSESIKLLQQHGITMLPADDTNILSSILETGHSVVLTEAGKQVLNSTKPVQSTMANIKKLTPKFKTLPSPIKPKKIITVTPQEFMAMTLNLNGKLVRPQKPTVKRIVMKKNKIIPITSNTNVVKIHKQENKPDIEMLMNQLIESKKLAEEYKQKFLKKEAEAERYKQQLLLITQSKKNYC